jgi:hypothetical protein
MAIHKLADGPLTMVVEATEETEGKFGPQVAFKNADYLLFISKKSADSQLKRLGLDVASAVGQTLHFEQVKKDGTTYTNISLASAGSATGPAAPSAPAAAAAAAAPKLTVADAAKVYADCFEQAMAIVGVKCEAAEVPFSGTDLVAAAATLFIRVMR